MSNRSTIPPYVMHVDIVKMNKGSYGISDKDSIVYTVKSSAKESIKFEFTIRASSVREAESQLQAVMSQWLQTDGVKYYAVTDALNAGKQTGNKNPRTPEQKQQQLVAELRQAVNDYRKAAKKAILSTTFPRERQKMVNRERSRAWKIANEYALKTGRSHPALIERTIMSNDNEAYYDRASSDNIDKQGLLGLDLLLDFPPPSEIRMFGKTDDPSHEFHESRIDASIATTKGGSQSARRKTSRYWDRAMRGEFDE